MNYYRLIVIKGSMNISRVVAWMNSIFLSIELSSANCTLMIRGYFFLIIVILGMERAKQISSFQTKFVARVDSPGKAPEEIKTCKYHYNRCSLRKEFLVYKQHSRSSCSQSFCTSWYFSSSDCVFINTFSLENRYI